MALIAGITTGGDIAHLFGAAVSACVRVRVSRLVGPVLGDPRFHVFHQPHRSPGQPIERLWEVWSAGDLHDAGAGHLEAFL
ncbi:hypothetical protein [Micromonospora sp. NBC_01638]|uniref:hypothetical protein n=1 Tax=Micromonospora sp. NBC_01638 TaxID=2975982 RepID=UPI00386E85F7